MYGMRTRFTTKPGELRQGSGSLSILRAKAMPLSISACGVSGV